MGVTSLSHYHCKNKIVVLANYLHCKNFWVVSTCKGCLSCAHVQRSNDNSIKYHISNK